jgi:hypothetical protein
MVMPEILKDEHLLESQENEFIEYMLCNSHVILTNKGSLEFVYGSILGVGDNNKDKPITLPRFMLFEFRKANPISGESHKWKLGSFESFADLEEHITFNIDFESNRVAALIDGVLVGFEMKDTICSPWQFGLRPTWTTDVLKLEITMKGEKIEETYNCKNAVEMRIIQLTREKAEEIDVYSIPDDERLYFRVLGELFKSVEQETDGLMALLDRRETHVVWLPKDYEEGPNWAIPCDEPEF